MLLRLFLTLCFLWLSLAQVSAHALASGSSEKSVGFELFQAGLLIAAVLLYARGVWRIRRHAGSAKVVTRSQTLAFSTGMTFVVVALLSPLDTLALELFSAHMVQHLLLILAAPPLLVWSRPALVFLWAFPAATRKGMAGFWNRYGCAGGVELLMRPLVVATLFTGVFAFWHLPGPYGWALANDWLHAIEHLSFFVTALMFWTMVIEPSGRRRMSFGATLLFVFAIAVLSGLPGALILLSPEPLYGVHEAGAAAWGLSPLQDQQLAGVVMWVPMGLFYLVPIGWLFLKLLEDAERRTATRAALPLLLLLLVPVVVAGCSEATSRTAEDEAAHVTSLVAQYGCGACHNIPGIDKANGRVGPPLDGFGTRVFIAGRLQNTPSNLTRWIMKPQEVAPGSPMPNMGVKPDEARVLAAYLEGLD